jgi:hypothetical protein
MSAPKYSGMGDLLCSCGEPMAGGIGPRGDVMYSCGKCQSSYIVGSLTKNPAPEIRHNQGMPVNPIYRYAFGEANWKVKDGHKE